MNNKPVTQKLFDAVKTMLECGAPVEEISKYIGLHRNTIYRIRKSENLEEYKHNSMTAAVYMNYKNKKDLEKAGNQTDNKQETHAVSQVVEHKQSVTLQTTYYVSQKLDKLCELLTAISAKLAFVVDELTK